MNVVDISLLVALGGFVLYGFWFGIIHMVGALLGVVVGAVAAGRLYGPVAHWLLPFVGSNENLAKILGFFIVFVLVNKLVGLAFWIIEKIFKFISIIPFLKTFNRLLGAALG
ncbi:MAG TPA: CvpA family protein, partial [Patescibacteria group bacterium]|nr:CvpA family protein [Patescibacteria group bacterium]